MNKKDKQQTEQTNAWFKAQGINIQHLHSGCKELFQATLLATSTLRDCKCALTRSTSKKLKDFLALAQSSKNREKITKGQCYQVMNISKQAQRLKSKLIK